MTTVGTSAIDILRNLHPWPAQRPVEKPIDWALDPWIGGPEVEKFARECRQPEWVGRQLAAHSDVIYHTFLTNLWDERQRVVPIRSTSWEALDQLAAAGLCPGLVYLDADKSGGEMENCRRLFPDALLAGDDWFWTPCPESHRTNDSDYPIRRPVRDFCERHGGHLVVDGSTWVILDRRPSWKHRFVIAPRYHLKRFGRRARLTVKHWMSGERAA